MHETKITWTLALSSRSIYILFFMILFRNVFFWYVCYVIWLSILSRKFLWRDEGKLNDVEIRWICLFYLPLLTIIKFRKFSNFSMPLDQLFDDFSSFIVGCWVFIRNANSELETLSNQRGWNVTKLYKKSEKCDENWGGEQTGEDDYFFIVFLSAQVFFQCFYHFTNNNMDHTTTEQIKFFISILSYHRKNENWKWIKFKLNKKQRNGADEKIWSKSNEFYDWIKMENRLIWISIIKHFVKISFVCQLSIIRSFAFFFCLSYRSMSQSTNCTCDKRLVIRLGWLYEHFRCALLRRLHWLSIWLKFTCRTGSDKSDFWQTCHRQSTCDVPVNNLSPHIFSIIFILRSI